MTKHECGNSIFGCVYNNKSNKLIVFINHAHFEANFCPICGFSIQPERSKREDLKVNYKKENFTSTTRSPFDSGYYPPPWRLNKKNKGKTDGWCAFQDYYLRGCGALNTTEMP